MINKKHITFKKEPFFDFAKELIKPESIVLDIGTGNANFADYCKRSDFYLYDGNKKTVNMLKKRYKNITYGLLPNLPFENNFFDIIHCSHVIEHLIPQVFYDSLVEIDRCLKVGGFVVISAPLMWEGFYNDLSHIKPYNPKVLNNYLCLNNSTSRTRKKISESYVQEKLVYRYREIDLLHGYIFPKKSLLSGLVLKLVQKLKRTGVNHLERTGYTIVLRKT